MPGCRLSGTARSTCSTLPRPDRDCRCASRRRHLQPAERRLTGHIVAPGAPGVCKRRGADLVKPEGKPVSEDALFGREQDARLPGLVAQRIATQAVVAAEQQLVVEVRLDDGVGARSGEEQSALALPVVIANFALQGGVAQPVRFPAAGQSRCPETASRVRRAGGRCSRSSRTVRRFGRSRSRSSRARRRRAKPCRNARPRSCRSGRGCAPCQSHPRSTRRLATDRQTCGPPATLQPARCPATV